MRSPLAISADLSLCASSWEPETRLLGNIRADELSFLAGTVLELYSVLMSSEPLNERDRMRLRAILEGIVEESTI